MQVPTKGGTCHVAMARVSYTPEMVEVVVPSSRLHLQARRGGDGEKASNVGARGMVPRITCEVDMPPVPPIRPEGSIRVVM
jgi:hypothetical protein